MGNQDSRHRLKRDRQQNLYSVFQVYEVGTTARPRVPTAGIERYVVSFLTYLLVLKERGFLDASQQRATKVVLQSLHVRLKSPNALWRLVSIVPKYR